MSEKDELVRRLRATEPLGMLSGCCDTVRLVNPDGPEAADFIERNSEAMHEVRELIAGAAATTIRDGVTCWLVPDAAMLAIRKAIGPRQSLRSKHALPPVTNGETK